MTLEYRNVSSTICDCVKDIELAASCPKLQPSVTQNITPSHPMASLVQSPIQPTLGNPHSAPAGRQARTMPMLRTVSHTLSRIRIPRASRRQATLLENRAPKGKACGVVLSQEQPAGARPMGSASASASALAFAKRTNGSACGAGRGAGSMQCVRRSESWGAWSAWVRMTRCPRAARLYARCFGLAERGAQRGR